MSPAPAAGLSEVASLAARLDALPRVLLAHLPTALQRAPRLSEALGVEVLVKRDDLTGLGLGGNKARILEPLLGEALAGNADVVLTAGGPQSNHAALTALAAARLGLDAHLVRYGSERPVEHEGNAALSSLAGARVTWTGDPDRGSVDPALDALAAELRAGGRVPYVVPRGGATALGATAYVRASLELAAQLDELGVTPARVVVATGSCGTQAGLVAGACALGARHRVVGVTVSRPRDECLRRVRTIADGCLALLGVQASAPEPEILDGYIGPGYGRPSEAGRSAATLAARTEGLVLDPVFTAKAMAALVERAAEDGGPVVFWHTGGGATAVAAGMLGDGGDL
jgi:D-cysteine desulfhydrase